VKNVLAALLVAVVESSRTPSVFQTITLLSVVRSSSLMIGERTTMQQKPALPISPAAVKDSKNAC